MIRVLLILLLVAASPLAAQSRDSARLLGSGSTVRLVLRSAPTEYVGAILGRSADSLRLIGAELGLARVAIADVERLDAEVSQTTKDAIVVAGSAAGGAAAGVLQGDGVVESLVAGTVLGVVLALAATASERREWRRVDPAARLRGDSMGALVRVSAPGLGFDRAPLRLLDFRSGTLYFREGDALVASRVEDITRLELSLGHARRRGVRLGYTAGALAGLLYGGSLALRENGQPLAFLPFMIFGLGAGGSVGGLAGYLLAAREWQPVPLRAPGGT